VWEAEGRPRGNATLGGGVKILWRTETKKTTTHRWVNWGGGTTFCVALGRNGGFGSFKKGGGRGWKGPL